MQFDIQPKDTSRGHFYVSVVKSAIRISAGTLLIVGSIVEPAGFKYAIAGTGALLILAEILGVVEELV